MKREGLGEQVRENLLGEGAKRIAEETLLIVDISDISKKYAQKTETRLGWNIRMDAYAYELCV